MSPSISATNANLLMQSDYFIVPCSPDYYCSMAINSLSEVIPTWNKTYERLKNHSVFSEAIYRLPDTPPKFIGTISQRFKLRNGTPSRAFQQWIDRININVNTNLVPSLKQNNMIIDEEKFHEVATPEEPYNIINLPDFNALIAQSQKYNVPIFALTPEQIEQVGKILEVSESSRDEFHETFTKLAQTEIALTS